MTNEKHHDTMFKLIVDRQKNDLKRQQKNNLKKLLTSADDCDRIQKLLNNKKTTLTTEQWNNLERFKRVSAEKRRSRQKAMEAGEKFKRTGIERCNLKTVSQKTGLKEFQTLRRMKGRRKGLAGTNFL